MKKAKADTSRMSVKALAAAHDRSVNAIHRQIGRAGLKPDKEGKYDPRKVASVLKAANERDNRNLEGMGGLLTGFRAKKAKLESDRLEIVIAELRKLSMPTAHVHALFRNYAAKVNGAFDQFVASVGVWTKDPHLNTEAKQIRDRIKKQLAMECESLESETSQQQEIKQ